MICHLALAVRIEGHYVENTFLNVEASAVLVRRQLADKSVRAAGSRPAEIAGCRSSARNGSCGRAGGAKCTIARATKFRRWMKRYRSGLWDPDYAARVPALGLMFARVWSNGTLGRGQARVRKPQSV